MAYEPHPYPERTIWRMAPPVTAAVLAAIGFAVMLAGPAGPARTVVMVVVLVAQVALMAGRAIVLFRAGRTADQPLYWHQFFFIWSCYTGGTYLLGSDDSTLMAVVNVSVGLVIAVLLVGVFLLMNRTPTRRDSGPPA